MKKTTIPQSTYGKSAQYVSSKTVRFPITVVLMGGACVLPSPHP